MKSEFVEDIDKCIEAALAPDQRPVALLADTKLTPEALFTLAYTELFQKFGAPDYPSFDGGDNGGARLGFTAVLFALWDFDYYTLSLRVDGDGEARYVVLQRHAP